jgi:hypothetical protein
VGAKRTDRLFDRLEHLGVEMLQRAISAQNAAPAMAWSRIANRCFPQLLNGG